MPPWSVHNKRSQCNQCRLATIETGLKTQIAGAPISRPFSTRRTGRGSRARVFAVWNIAKRTTPRPKWESLLAGRRMCESFLESAVVSRAEKLQQVTRPAGRVRDRSHGALTAGLGLGGHGHRLRGPNGPTGYFPRKSPAKCPAAAADRHLWSPGLRQECGRISRPAFPDPNIARRFDVWHFTTNKSPRGACRRPVM